MKSILLITFFIAIAQSLPTNFNSFANFKIPLKSHYEANKKIMKGLIGNPDPSVSIWAGIDKDCVKRALNIKTRDYYVNASEASFIMTIVNYLCTSDAQLSRIFNYDLVNGYQDGPVTSPECLQLKLSKYTPAYSIARNPSVLKTDLECETELTKFDEWIVSSRTSGIKGLSHFPQCSDEFYDSFIPMDAAFIVYLRKKQFLPAERFTSEMEYVRNYRNFAQRTISCVMNKLNTDVGMQYPSNVPQFNFKYN